jgi:hypothetical protein
VLAKWLSEVQSPTLVVIILFATKFRPVVRLTQRFSNCGARPQEGAVGPWGGGRVVCVRYTIILNEIWAQDKIYILVVT